jgi:hypothetical protein
MTTLEGFVFTLTEDETQEWATPEGRAALLEQMYTVYGPTNDHVPFIVLSAAGALLLCED